jgi:hypothetical protein
MDPENRTRNFWLLVASGLLVFVLLAVAPAAAGSSPGSLDVYTSPGGSSVCIDSNYCRISSESTGMAYFSGLAVNQYHTITVTNYGFQTYTDTIYLDPYATNLLTSAILQPSSGNPGTIWVEIYPYGGTICMDGRDCSSYGPADYNGWTSVSYSNLAPNQYHTLTVSLNGFQPYTQTIWMNPGGSMTLPDIRLQPLYR